MTTVKHRLLLLVLGITGLLWGAQAGAALVADLSTGSAVYTLESPGVVTGATATMNPSLFPASGPYLTDLGSALWISKASDPNGSAAVGDYYFQTTFDLTGYVVGTAWITGSVRSDNALLDVRLNGNSLGISSGGSITSFADASPVSLGTITTFFVPGLNTLTFVVNNADCGGCTNPVGLLSNAQANADPVPIPAAIWLLGSSLLGLIGLARRKSFAS
jgi:hypothetical protein